MPSYVEAQLKGASGFPDAQSPPQKKDGSQENEEKDPSPMTQKVKAVGFAAFFRKGISPNSGQEKKTKASLMAKIRRQR